MTAIKMCGLTRTEDIAAVNEIMPEYIGFVFYNKSKRFVTPEKAAFLKQFLSPRITAVGVFIDEKPETIASLLNDKIIDAAQLHGQETDEYIRMLRQLTDKPLIKAFRVKGIDDILQAGKSTADFILLDAGAGDGITFDWSMLKEFERPYFLAGGLDCENVISAVKQLHPFAVDVSSGIETEGMKDKNKMAAFAAAVRKEDQQ